MTFMNYIIKYLNDASDFFYSIYREVYDWVWPFWQAAEFFYDLCLVFNRLAWRFSDFAEWVNYIADEVLDILSWSNIRSLIRSWLPGLEDAIDWFLNWVYWVNRQITNWWDTTYDTVKTWVLARINDVEELIDSLTSWLASLQSEWDEFKGNIPPITLIISWFANWWGSILANIIAWGALTATQIDSLIDSWFKSYQPFWEGWLEWKDKVAEFFTDPLQWFYNKLDEFFERFW